MIRFVRTVKPFSVLRRWLLPLLLTAAGTATAWAHDPGLSTMEGTCRDGRLTLTVTFSDADARQLLAASRRDAGAAATASDATWRDLARRWCEVTSGGVVRTPETVVTAGPERSARPRPQGGAGFTLSYTDATGSMRISAMALALLPRGHRQFTLITGTGEQPLVQKFLTANDPTVGFDVPGRQVTAKEPRRDSTTFFSFFRLGVEHIWTGYDHLLFLFGLLVICRSFRSIAGIISCFTIAHSLTLAAATLDLVHVPSQWVECTIAASIAFVGLENVARRGREPPGRAALTFLFGLIHGFGFASALRDLGVGHDGGGVAVPLCAFNLGVEAGQVVVAAVALPLLRQLRRGDRFVRHGVPAVSSFVAVAGVVWFVQRAVAG